MLELRRATIVMEKRELRCCLKVKVNFFLNNGEREWASEWEGEFRVISRNATHCAGSINSCHILYTRQHSRIIYVSPTIWKRCEISVWTNNHDVKRNFSFSHDFETLLFLLGWFVRARTRQLNNTQNESILCSRICDVCATEKGSKKKRVDI